MIRILIDARESGTSTGRYIDKLIENLAKLDTDLNFSVVTKPHRKAYLKSIAPSFDIEITGFKEFTLSEQRGFKTQIEAIDADLVHFGMVQQPIMYAGKVVTTIHDLTMTWEDNPSRNKIVHKTKQQVYKQVIKRAANKSLAIICPSEFVKQDLVKFSGIDPSKVTVTYESADKIKDPAEELSKLKNKQFIMYVGRPMPHKNLEKLIEAFVLLKESNPKLYLVLAGKLDFNYNQIKVDAAAKNIPDVIFTDFISEGKLKWLYQNCAAYIFPSISEGFGLPGIEAMVHGAPVISSNATCLPEIYGKAAEYFNPLDVKDMADTISKVLDNESLRAKLVSLGFEQASKYSWRRMAEQTLEIYKKVLS